jgi:hypothetical protein
LGPIELESAASLTMEDGVTYRFFRAIILMKNLLAKSSVVPISGRLLGSGEHAMENRLRNKPVIRHSFDFKGN